MSLISRFSVADQPSIVILTGGKEFYQHRFGHRIQTEFQDLVVGWYECSAAMSSVSQTEKKDGSRTLFPKSIKQKAAVEYERGGWSALLSHFPSTVRRFFRAAQERNSQARFLKSLRKAEKKLFGHEVQKLQNCVFPEPISILDLNASEVVQAIRKLNPYLLICLDTPMLSQELQETARKAVLYQNEGKHILSALYHRCLDEVSASIYSAVPGNVSHRAVLKKSWPCLSPFETPASCFLRTVTLGTELMIDSIREIIETGKVPSFQEEVLANASSGNQYSASSVYRDIERDFKDGWLDRELMQTRKY